MNVAVIGGGISGIRAALTLARAGARVALLEKNAHLGGRVFSFPTPDFGETDIGQHIWLRSCTAFEGLLADLGVPAASVWRQDRVAMTYRWPDGSSYLLAGRRGPAALAALAGLVRMPHLSLPEKLRYAWTTLRVKFASARAIETVDDVSIADWLHRHRQSPALIEVFWEPFLKGVCNGQLEAISARHALSLLRETLLKSPADAAICLLRCPLSAVFDRLARATLSASGVEVRTGTAVAGVAPGETVQVRIRSGEALAFNRVVVAVPPKYVRALLPAAKLPEPPAAGAIVGVLVRFARPVMEEMFFTAVGTPLQHVFNKTLIRAEHPADGSQVLELVLSAAEQEAKREAAELSRELLPHLGKLLPAVRDTPVLAQRRVVHATATFRVPPGGEAQRLALARVRLPHVVLAGDYAATGLPSTMESACRAGQAAARTVLGP
jgi:squalene-associated FAD-dependent desaturase